MLKSLIAITLTAQAWALHTTAPTTLSDPRSNEFWPNVAINTEGRAVVSWISSQNRQESIRVSHREKEGSTWSTPRMISNWVYTIWDPRSHIDDSGNLSVLWEIEAKETFAEYWQWAKKVDGIDWSTAADLTEEGHRFWNDSLAFEPNGQVVGVHVEEQLMQNGWQKQYVVQAIPVSSSEKAETATLQSSVNYTASPSIATSPEGKAFSYWLSGAAWPKNGYTIWGSWRNEKNEWSAPEEICTTQEYTRNLQAAISSEGVVSLVWEDGRDHTVQAIVHSKEGWSEVSTLSSADELPDDLGIAIDSKGNLMVIWEVERGDQQVVCAAYKPSEQPWTESIDISLPEEDSHSIMNPILAYDNAGHFIIVWTQYHENFPTIWGSQFSIADGTFSEPCLLSPTDQACGAPSIAFAKTKGLISWVTTSNGFDRMVQVADLIAD